MAPFQVHERSDWLKELFKVIVKFLMNFWSFNANPTSRLRSRPPPRIFKPKDYRAKLSYLPHPVDPESGSPVPGDTLPEVRLPPLSSPLPDSWTTIEDEFRIAYALNLSHLDPITMFAPQRHDITACVKTCARVPI